MIIWVAEKCEKVLGKKLVYVATDDERIHATVKTFGFQTISTSKNSISTPKNSISTSKNSISTPKIRFQHLKIQFQHLKFNFNT